LAQPAVGLDAHWQPAQPGNPEATRLLDGLEPEGLWAVVADVGDTDGDDQWVVSPTGIALDSRPLDESPGVRWEVR